MIRTICVSKKSKWGICLNKFDDDLKRYNELFVKFNAIHNLSAYKDILSVKDDSLAPFDEFGDIFAGAKTAIDIGSGAGIPAVFLAMRARDCQFHLFEPASKKASFLSFLKASLGLENIFIHSVKIQDEKPFIADIIVSRAAFKIIDLLGISKGFYDEKTSFLLYKGTSYNDELNAIKGQYENSRILKNQNRNYILLEGVKC